MKKEYETPNIYFEVYELENIAGNLCSGIGDIPTVYPTNSDGSEMME